MCYGFSLETELFSLKLFHTFKLQSLGRRWNAFCSRFASTVSFQVVVAAAARCKVNPRPRAAIPTVQGKRWADPSPLSSSDMSVIGVSHLSSALTMLYWPFSKPPDALLVRSRRWAWIRPTGTGIIANMMSRARTARAQPGYSRCPSEAWTRREGRRSVRAQALMQELMESLWV